MCEYHIQYFVITVHAADDLSSSSKLSLRRFFTAGLTMSLIHGPMIAPAPSPITVHAAVPIPSDDTEHAAMTQPVPKKVQPVLLDALDMLSMFDSPLWRATE
jgi:hypothetical protein